MLATFKSLTARAVRLVREMETSSAVTVGHRFFVKDAILAGGMEITSVVIVAHTCIRQTCPHLCLPKNDNSNQNSEERLWRMTHHQHKKYSRRG
mmetsp:Transcript_3539/g.6257  ORF Transcript_3539/g.6257 Transcript_3539/m.6257 type:complete len:94 (-) Transcript_3539:214-495(-)